MNAPWKATSPADLDHVLRTAPVILLSGPTDTRLAHEFGRPSPDGASFVQIFDPEWRDVLRTIYAGLMAVAGDHDVPMMADTPTWRAHPDGLARQGYTDADDLRRVNREAAKLVRSIRRDLGLDHLVVIAGAVGPKHDGCDPARAPSPRDAETYDRAQVEALAAAGVDLLYAPTFPNVDELTGVALAFAATGLPYVLALTVDARGCLPDRCPLEEAVERVPAAAVPAPSLFAVGCVHPSTLSEARGAPAWPRRRLVAGIAANGSDLRHDVLDGMDHIEADAPGAFAERLVWLYREGCRLIDGCCDTDDTHLRAFADLISAG